MRSQRGRHDSATNTHTLFCPVLRVSRKQVLLAFTPNALGAYLPSAGLPSFEVYHGFISLLWDNVCSILLSSLGITLLGL